MILNINGDLNRYYAQTLCMIFFPGADFSEKQEITHNTPVVDFNIITTEIGVMVQVNVKCGDHIESAEIYKDFVPEYTAEKSIKIAAGAAMVTAGKKMFGCVPPWGILTGVRPSKLAVDCLRQGKKIKEIKKILIDEYYVNPKKATLVTNISVREEKIIKKLPKNACSLYISIPFCPSRCAYCSFVSYSTKRLLSLIPEYLNQLLNDLTEMFGIIKSLGQKVVTIYIGGGTPTILTPEQLEILLLKITEHINVSELLEFSLEAGRPDTITREKINVALKYGVNRVSINPQTLNEKVLFDIGRKHTIDDFYRAFDITRECGVPIINADLIAGLPGDSYASFSHTVEELLALRPENIMCHTFCVKKSADILKNGTEIYSIDGGETGKCIDYTQITTKNAGYVPYYMYRQKNTIGNFENVGFSLEGMEGKYNIFIMEEVHSIFSVGAGASIKVVSPDRKNIVRHFMPKYPYEYLVLKDKPEYKTKIYNEIYKFYDEYFGEVKK
jgi:coproporphyrinogen dehydrogenase HemZ